MNILRWIAYLALISGGQAILYASFMSPDPSIKGIVFAVIGLLVIRLGFFVLEHRAADIIESLFRKGKTQ